MQYADIGFMSKIALSKEGKDGSVNGVWRIMYPHGKKEGKKGGEGI